LWGKNLSDRIAQAARKRAVGRCSFAVVKDTNRSGADCATGVDIALGIPDHDCALKAPETEVVAGAL
jgi:hypothetical protein